MRLWPFWPQSAIEELIRPWALAASCRVLRPLGQSAECGGWLGGREGGRARVGGVSVVLLALVCAFVSVIACILSWVETL